MFPELAALEAEFQKNLAIARGEFCEMDRTTEDSESMKSEGRDTPAADDSPLSIVPPLNEVGGAPKSPKLAKPDPLATRWAEKNKWFGTDMEMTQAAYDAHDELIAKGMDSSSKQYYRELRCDFLSQDHNVSTGGTNINKRSFSPNLTHTRLRECRAP